MSERDKRKNYTAFGKAVFGLIRNQDNFFGDEWSEEILPIAVEAGLAERIESYDPETHGCVEDVEPGDPFWRWK